MGSESLCFATMQTLAAAFKQDSFVDTLSSADRTHVGSEKPLTVTTAALISDPHFLFYVWILIQS